MLTWPEFREARPDLADAGRSLFYQYGGVGLGFLGTVRLDGGPRVHPMCPVITEDGIYAMLVPSPKLQDLMRDGRYAMHSFPCDDNEDAFYITGRAETRDDAEARARVARQFLAERSWDTPPPGFDEQDVVEFSIERCLLTRTTGHGDPDPQHTIWKAAD
jgi:nitroimidazol reductase NimA-like FMN-containing flavoprotein (pyridoxamine 5'-phosphate oxidase superfamily)